MILSRIRPWLFLFFVGAFGVTAALILFFAFGYRYSFERGIFIYSGSITLATTPDAVDITVDGEPLPEKRLGILNNSIHINGLIPGEHHLRISASEHHTWEKEVVIESGVSREFWNIILPREHYPITLFPDTDTVTKIFPHPRRSDRFLFLKSERGETLIAIFNAATNTSTQVFSLPLSTFDTAGPENIEWSWFEDGRYIALPLTVQGVLRHLVVDTTNGSYFTLEDRLGRDHLSAVRWETSQERSLLFLQDNQLFRFDITGDLPPQSITEGVLTYTLSDGVLYFVADTGEVWREDGNRFVTITQSLPFERDVPISLTVYDKDRVALLEKDGARRLIAVYPSDRWPSRTIKEVARGVVTTQFSDDGKKLLFASNNDIGVLFTEDWDVQPRRTAGDVVQVARFSDAIKNVQWAESYEHIVFSNGNTVKFIELDGRDQRLISDITTLPSSPIQILPIFSNNELYLLTPGSNIATLTFPEEQGLFGE